jgi:hypothetical protein
MNHLLTGPFLDLIHEQSIDRAKNVHVGVIVCIVESDRIEIFGKFLDVMEKEKAL